MTDITHPPPPPPYTAKNYDLFKVVENRMQQCCAAYIVHSCQQYCFIYLFIYLTLPYALNRTTN